MNSTVQYESLDLKEIDPVYVTTFSDECWT